MKDAYDGIFYYLVCQVNVPCFIVLYNDLMCCCLESDIVLQLVVNEVQNGDEGSKIPSLNNI